ncbi:hypothetical protein Tco_1462569 [Tanacetum coccineum]
MIGGGKHAMKLRPKKKITKDHAAIVSITTKKGEKNAMVPCVSGIHPNLCKGKTTDMDQDKGDHKNKKKNALVVYQQNGDVQLCDLDLEPKMIANSHVGTDLSLHYTPMTPDPARKARPKVNDILLGDINSEGVDGDGTDEDKAKWWEEERRVLRG